MSNLQVKYGYPFKSCTHLSDLTITIRRVDNQFWRWYVEIDYPESKFMKSRSFGSNKRFLWQVHRVAKMQALELIRKNSEIRYNQIKSLPWLDRNFG